MGAWYSLVNFTKREKVVLVHLGGCKAEEIACFHPVSAIAVWYMLRYRGDNIAFVSDVDIESGRNFFGEIATYELINAFPDRCEETIAHAVGAKVVADHGRKWQDDAEPDVIYGRDIRVGPPDDGKPRTHFLE